MREFWVAAAPFVVIGICLAVIFAHYRKMDRDEANGEKNYLLEGMCIGMCLGVSLSAAFHVNIGLGVSLGMLVGETVGMFIKRK